ncbi:MAG TPA: DUF2945 domain-containing protein [Streptomyces sp.]|nr:DUF2945 domain-containing protein [Streptomyces sp.]
MPRRTEKFRAGDRVSWRSHGSETTGTVGQEVAPRTEAADRTVGSSPDAPRHPVRSDRTGRRAVHRPEALRRRNSEDDRAP